ncbi:hypothetical protein MTO96_033317 [Rhipicephalus appendiculatus]
MTFFAGPATSKHVFAISCVLLAGLPLAHLDEPHSGSENATPANKTPTRTTRSRSDVIIVQPACCGHAQAAPVPPPAPTTLGPLFFLGRFGIGFRPPSIRIVGNVDTQFGRR